MKIKTFEQACGIAAAHNSIAAAYQLGVALRRHADGTRYPTGNDRREHIDRMIEALRTGLEAPAAMTTPIELAVSR